MNILFVCSGNVSRSFLAEMLLRSELERQGLRHISVSSAGLYAYPDNPPDPKMVDYLDTVGVLVKKGGARPLTQEDVEWADQILVMEKDHLGRLTGKWPEASEKTELLGSYTSEGPVPDDIIDPFGRSSYHYRLSQAQITLAIQNLLKRLSVPR